LIAIGYGFFLELTFSEAIKFVQQKVLTLKNIATEKKTQASKIKANIRFVIEGLKEIQNINFNTKNENKAY
jgi:prefoldin subunit 5